MGQKKCFSAFVRVCIWIQIKRDEAPAIRSRRHVILCDVFVNHRSYLMCSVTSVENGLGHIGLQPYTEGQNLTFTVTSTSAGKNIYFCSIGIYMSLFILREYLGNCGTKVGYYIRTGWQTCDVLTDTNEMLCQWPAFEPKAHRTERGAPEHILWT